MKNGDLFRAAAEQPDYEPEYVRDPHREFTPDEVTEGKAIIDQWHATYALWIDSGKMCDCGRPISFEDALDRGSCIDCLHEMTMQRMSR